MLVWFSFTLSGETIRSELLMLDAWDISTTEVGESLALQAHTKNEPFLEVDEQLEHFVDFLPKPLLAICLTLQQTQLEGKTFPLFEEKNQTERDMVSRW